MPEGHKRSYQKFITLHLPLQALFTHTPSQLHAGIHTPLGYPLPYCMLGYIPSSIACWDTAPVNRMTDRCKTLLRLWTVKISVGYFESVKNSHYFLKRNIYCRTVSKLVKYLSRFNFPLKAYPQSNQFGADALSCIGNN